MLFWRTGSSAWKHIWQDVFPKHGRSKSCGNISRLPQKKWPAPKAPLSTFPPYVPALELEQCIILDLKRVGLAGMRQTTGWSVCKIIHTKNGDFSGTYFGLCIFANRSLDVELISGKKCNMKPKASFPCSSHFSKEGAIKRWYACRSHTREREQK